MSVIPSLKQYWDNPSRIPELISVEEAQRHIDAAINGCRPMDDKGKFSFTRCVPTVKSVVFAAILCGAAVPTYKHAEIRRYWSHNSSRPALAGDIARLTYLALCKKYAPERYAEFDEGYVVSMNTWVSVAVAEVKSKFNGPLSRGLKSHFLAPTDLADVIRMFVYIGSPCVSIAGIRFEEFIYREVSAPPGARDALRKMLAYIAYSETTPVAPVAREVPEVDTETMAAMEQSIPQVPASELKNLGGPQAQSMARAFLDTFPDMLSEVIAILDGAELTEEGRVTAVHNLCILFQRGNFVQASLKGNF